MTNPPPWSPRKTLKEELKFLVVPPRLYMRYRAVKELWKGERELHLLPALVDPDRVAVDAGANKGVWSHMLAKRTKTVHAFEPNPKLFQVLKKCAAGNVICHQVALSDKAGTARLNVPVSHGGYSNQRGTLRPLGEDEPFGAVEVKTARLDDLDLGDIGFIKIDVEGHELKVIAGARETLARCRPNLIIEIEEKHTNRPIEDQVGEVEAYGYRCLVHHRGSLKFFSDMGADAIHRKPSEAAGLAACGLVLVAAARGLAADDRTRVGKALVAGVVLALVVLAIEYVSGSMLNIAARPDQWDSAGTLAPHARLSLLKSGAAVTAILIWPAAAFLWRRAGPVSALSLLAIGGIVLAFAAGLAGKLAWVAGALVLAAALLRFRVAAIAFAALFGLLMLAAPTIPNGYLMPALKSGQITFLPYSTFHRIFIWGYTAERIAERPLAGWGLNAAKQFGASMPPVRMEIELEDREDWINISEPIPLHPHNAVLQIWLELGLPGVLLAALLLGAVLLAIARMPGTSGERAFALAALAAALLVASFSFGIWQNWWMAALWLVGALTAMSAPRQDNRVYQAAEKLLAIEHLP